MPLNNVIKERNIFIVKTGKIVNRKEYAKTTIESETHRR